MARKKRKGPLTDKELQEANRRHDEQFGRQDVKTWRGKSNNVYETAERDTLGTAWNNRLQYKDNWSSKSKAAQDAVLRNQIRIKKMKNE